MSRSVSIVLPTLASMLLVGSACSNDYSELAQDGAAQRVSLPKRQVKRQAAKRVPTKPRPKPTVHTVDVSKLSTKPVFVDGIAPLLDERTEYELRLNNPKGLFKKIKALEAKRASASKNFIKLHAEAADSLKYNLQNINKSSSSSHFSWRELGMTTPIKNQNPYGTCWAFGSIGAMESNYLIHHREAVDLSEQDLINCNCRACDGSSKVQHGEKREVGVREDSFNTYVGDGNKKPCQQKWLDNCGTCDLTNQTPYRVSSVFPVDPAYTGDGAYPLEPVPVAAMKAAIVKYGPIYVKMHIPKGSKIGSHKGDGVFDETVELVYEPERNTGAHMVVLTGWDDGKQAWEMRNSWGTGWGTGGYGWIKYGSNKIGMSAHVMMMHVPGHRTTAVWRKGAAEEIQVHGWEYDDYRARYDKIWPDGWRLHDLEVHVEGGVPLYNAVWRKGAVSEKQVYGWTYADYQKKYDELWKQGWRIHMLQTFVTKAGPRYTAVWRKGNNAEVQHYGKTYTEYQSLYDDLWKKGWRIYLLNEYVVGNQVRYDAVWRKGKTAEIQHYGQNYTAYRAKYDELWKKGWRLYILNNYIVGGQLKYSAVWRPSKAAEVQVYGWDYEAYRLKDEELRTSGWRLAMLESF